jgi:hypothetical protein
MARHIRIPEEQRSAETRPHALRSRVSDELAPASGPRSRPVQALIDAFFDGDEASFAIEQHAA